MLTQPGWKNKNPDLLIFAKPDKNNEMHGFNNYLN
jgi:hypothetical protein